MKISISNTKIRKFDDFFRNFWIFCTSPLPRSTFRRRRGTSRTAPEEHGAATGRRKRSGQPLAPRRRAHFPKTTFSPKMASRSAPGASPRPPRTPTGRPLSLPGSPGEVPELVFYQKLCQNWPKCMKKGICHGFSKSTRFSITFCMDFGSFFVVFFVAFFARAFSKKCRCCKVRHARILWFLQWNLTIFTFHVFLAKAKKAEIPARISMQKT